jgi:PmbA protein
MVELDEGIDLVLRRAHALGGAEADVLAVESDRLEAGVRLGETEKLKRSRERRLAVRLFVGRSSAIASTSDLTPSSLETLVSDCRELARATAADPFGGLADVGDQLPWPAELGLFDSTAQDVTAEEAISLAQTAERAALECDARLTNSEGAEVWVSGRRLAYATSRGFRGAYRSSHFSLTVVPVAVADGSMQRDYWYTAGRRRAALEDPRTVGVKAAARALRRLGARSVANCEVPVVFDPETAASLIGHLGSACCGSAVYRGMSFLRDRLGSRIAPRGIRIVDDPLRHGGLGARPFDAEGLTSRRNVVVEDGVLQTFLLDTYSARKLGAASTANAVRALAEPPSAGVSNFHLERGIASPEDVIGSVRRGFYVTELIGSAVNPVTGDYSRGAAGMWIENGRLEFPVEEVTIAGNLNAMLAGIDGVANDLEFRSAVSAPTLRVAKMTVAGRN